MKTNIWVDRHCPVVPGRSAKRRRTIDAEVLKIIGESHEEAGSLLSAHRKQPDALAEALVSARDSR